MKRLILIFSAIAVLAGCHQLDEFDQPVQNGSSIEGEFIGANLPEVLYAGMSEDDTIDTRTYTEENKVLWHNGDAISYYAGRNGNVKYVYNGEDGVTGAEFERSGNPQYEYSDIPYEQTSGFDCIPDYSMAAYPYYEDHMATYHKEGKAYYLRATYVKDQTYAPKSFGKNSNLMIGTGESGDDTSLYFRNACGYLVIKLYGAYTKVKSISLAANNEDVKISSYAIIEIKQDTDFKVSMNANASNVVNLDCSNGGNGVAIGADEQNATEFWFALPPTTIEGGFNITIKDADGFTYTKQTTKDVVIERNTIQPMAAFAIGQTAPTPSQIWYTQAKGVTTPITFSEEEPFDATIIGHSYNAERGIFVVQFASPVKVIKEEAFYYNTNILDITLPHGLETIEQQAFEGSSLSSVNIPGTVTFMGDDLFYNCKNLKYLTFEPSPTKTPLEVESALFFNGYNVRLDLTRLEVNRDFVQKSSIFSYSGADEIIIGEQLSKIYESMFSYSDITSLEIPSHITEIGSSAFSYNSNLTKLKIHKDVTSIGVNAFSGCSRLAELTIEDSNATLSIGNKDYGEEFGPFYDSPLQSIYVGRNIVYLNEFEPDEDDEGVFAVDSKLNATTTVKIGSKVTALSDYMFADCPIETLTIPGNVNTIGSEVFSGCEKLKTVSFKPSAENTPLVLQNGKNGLFEDCPLESAYYNRSGNNDYLFADASSLTQVTIGEQVETLGAYMFDDTALTSITIPGNVTKLTLFTFEGCSDLSYVKFEPSNTGTSLVFFKEENDESRSPFQDCPLETVDLYRNISSDFIFSSVKTLTTVNIGEQVSTLGRYAFSTTGITSITIPGTVTSIGVNAFLDCDYLSTVNIQDGPEPLQLGIQSIRGLISGDWGPFYDSPLTSITLKRNIAYKYYDEDFIPDYGSQGLFANEESGNVERTEISLGGSLTEIQDYMFYGVAVEKIWIPREITSIGKSAFEDCEKLLGITCNHTTPPTLGEDAFNDCDKMYYISILKGTLSAFMEADGWKEFYSMNFYSEWEP